MEVKMRILIIGGTGLIGQALASNLISTGNQVWTLSRHPEAVPAKGANAMKWDGQTTTGWEKQAAEVDAIVNLAGENIGASRWTRERKERMRRSRIDAGKAVVDALRPAMALSGHSPKVIVQSSAIGYYGPSDDREISETAPSGRDFLSKLCVEWEGSTEPVEEMGIRRVIIRTGLVLSLSGGVLPRMLLPFKLFVGGPVGSGRQWYSWIHIRDEVEAIRFFLENDSTHGVYNLTSPNPLTNADLGRLIARSFKRPYWIPAPAVALRLVLGEMSTLVLDGQKVLPERLLKAGYQFHFPTAEIALKDLAGN
jgi:uncharacterized protein (TIGR01777 family)